jgi:hypothetical protein
MIIQHVPVNLVAQVWPHAKEYVALGLQHTSSHTIEHAEVHLSTGAWTLLVAVLEDNSIVGAYVIAFQNEPASRNAFIVSAGGVGLAGEEAFDQVKAIAKSMGATKIQVLARESAARLYKRVGLEEKATLMEITL